MNDIKTLPLRMCCVCREKKPKKQMLKVVKNPDGAIFLDLSYKQNGRSAYVCKSKTCIEKCLKGKALNRSFSMEVSKEVYEQLKSFIESELNEK